jgi:hypothetical protein
LLDLGLDPFAVGALGAAPSPPVDSPWADPAWTRGAGAASGAQPERSTPDLEALLGPLPSRPGFPPWLESDAEVRRPAQDITERVELAELTPTPPSARDAPGPASVDSLLAGIEGGHGAISPDALRFPPSFPASAATADAEPAAAAASPAAPSPAAPSPAPAEVAPPRGARAPAAGSSPATAGDTGAWGSLSASTRLRSAAEGTLSLALLLAIAVALYVGWQHTGVGAAGGALRARRASGGGAAALAVAALRGGAYDTETGAEVLVVRGRVIARSPLAAPARVAVELVEDGRVVARGEGLAGREPTPEQVYAAGTPEGARVLRRALDRGAAALDAGGEAPFGLVLAVPAPGVRRYEIRARAEPAEPR